MKMTIARARKLFSITEKDDLTSLKKKYHKLMSKHHPDALGSDRPEHIRKAQEINEAYRLLKENPEKFGTEIGNTNIWEEKTPQEWSEKINEWAFWERNIYLYYSLEVSEILLYYKVARGKYFWDPQEEEFPLFLISIHKLVKEVLNDAETDLAIQSRLFHYLAEQFIEPVEVLRKIAKPEKVDREGKEIYHFSAYLKGHKQKICSEGMILYPKAFRENQIVVRDREGTEYGSLSFDDDRLYFCMIPLLKQKAAKIKMEYHRRKVDFYFRLEKEAEQYEIPNRNLEIAKLLKRV